MSVPAHLLDVGVPLVLIRHYGISSSASDITPVTVAKITKTRVDLEYKHGRIERWIIRDGALVAREGGSVYHDPSVFAVDSKEHKSALAGNQRQDTVNNFKKAVDTLKVYRVTIEQIDEALVAIDAYKALLITEVGEE